MEESESWRQAWGLRQGGLRNLVENGMRVLGGCGAHSFHPDSFSCPLDPEAVPDSDEKGLFSPLDTGVNRAPKQELRIWPKVTSGVSGRAQKQPETPDLPSLAREQSDEPLPSHVHLPALPLPRQPVHLSHTHAPAQGCTLHREVCVKLCVPPLPRPGTPSHPVLSGPSGLGRPKPHP